MWDAIWDGNDLDRWDEVEVEVLDLDTDEDEDTDGDLALDLDTDEVTSLDEWLAGIE